MRIPLVLAVLAVLVALTGCEDIRRFAGDWDGPISADPLHRQGFGEDARLSATVGMVSRRSAEISLSWDGGAPLPFQPIRGTADDALGELRLDGEPLRTYLGYLTPAGQAPYLAAVSLFSEDRIDVRIIRGPSEIYGVFSLHRRP